jgi:uncharacterized membrane protein
MHADRTNRFMISLIGLIALVLGVGGLLAAGGVFGHTFQHKQLVANGFSRYIGHHGVWLWPAIAVVTLGLVLLALLWLLRLLLSTDRTSRVAIATRGKKREDGQASGRTTMTATALSQAVVTEIGTYHGVTNAKARMLGDPGNPTLAIEVSASRRAELRPLIERIESQAIGHARTALERPDLPVKLDVAVNDKSVSRTTR